MQQLVRLFQHAHSKHRGVRAVVGSEVSVVECHQNRLVKTYPKSCQAFSQKQPSAASCLTSLITHLASPL
jgi:hypothetical protein